MAESLGVNWVVGNGTAQHRPASFYMRKVPDIIKQQTLTRTTHTRQPWSLTVYRGGSGPDAEQCETIIIRAARQTIHLDNAVYEVPGGHPWICSRWIQEHNNLRTCLRAQHFSGGILSRRVVMNAPRRTIRDETIDECSIETQL